MLDQLTDAIAKLPEEYKASIGAFLMGAIIAALRVVYDQKETQWTRICLESLICGTLGVGFGAGIDALGYDRNWTIFASCIIGFMGSQWVRALAKKFIIRKVGDQ